MIRSLKLIFTRKLTVIAMLLLISNLAPAANIDFKTINDNASKNCTDNHTKANCTNVNEQAVFSSRNYFKKSQISY